MIQRSPVSRRLRQMLLLGTLAMPILPLTGQIVSPGGSWKVQPWTSDATSGVDSQFVYTHSYSFGSNDSTTINGVNFIGGGEGPSSAGRYSWTGFDSTFGPVSPNNLTGNSATLAKDFRLGAPQSLTLSNLKPSTAYVFTVYGVGFDASGVRSATFSSNRVAGDSLTVNLNQYGQGKGIRVIHEFTSDANGSPVTISFPDAAGSVGHFHTSGFSNREAAASSPPVAWTTAAWNDDATSGVSPNHRYTHAFNFNSIRGLNLNGIPFTGLAGGNPSRSNLTVSGVPAGYSNDVNNLTGYGTVMGRDFILGGYPAVFDLSGLTPNKQYVFTLYSVGWADSGSRRGLFRGGVGEGATVLDQNQFGNNNGIRFEYRYTANSTGTNKITVGGFGPAVGLHLYGLSNREAVALANVAPSITLQPAGGTFNSGGGLTLRVGATGSAPLSYQWNFNGSPISGATDPILQLTSIDSSKVGSYTVTVTNGSSSVTSGAASVGLFPPANGQDPGITISRSGIMLKDGKPYRAIGGHDVFDSVEWFEGDNANYEQTFADLKASGMKYVRLTTKGYYPWWKLSSLQITDKAAYFAKMDAMINCAAQNDIGVMLGLFWTVFAVSEFYGESELAAATPGSKTYVAMAQFCTEMATHYKDNPAVVGYDVIGELSLLPDQPNSGQPANGRWTSEATQVVYANLFQAIRAVDPTRMLSSANGSPPENQFHRTNYGAWNPDTPAQSSYETDISHPDPVDVIGVHYYPNASTGSGVNWDLTNALSLQRRKPLLGGEFGGGAAANFNFALSELLRNRVPLMATWYIGAPQDSSAPYNLFGWSNPTNDNAYQWNALAQANSQYVYRPWKNLATTSGSWNASSSWESGPVPTTADDVYVPTDATTPRSLSITSTAYARNLAIGTAATGNLPATIDINGAGQLVLGQNSDLSIPSTSDGTTANTLTVTGAHGQLLDVSSRSSVLRIQQSTGETKPAIVANTVSAYQMKTSDRVNISAETTQLNLFDGMVVGQGASSAATVYQTGGTVRIGLDANLVGGTPAGLVIGAGSSTPKYVLSGGTLATSGISGTTNAVIDWQAGTIRTLDGASMSVSPVVDIQLNTAGIHSLNAAEANQSITVNATARITGSGNLTKSGPGKLSFLGTSSDYTYSGTTSISDGILQVKNAGALPGWNTVGKVSVGARTPSTLDGTVAIGTLALNIGGSGEWTTANLTTLLGASGRVTFGAGSALGIDTTNAPGTVTLTTPITGSKGLTKLGSGNLTLNPNSNNTFTGMTTILGGTLQLGTTANTIIPAGSGFDVRGGTLDLGTKNITFSGTYSALTANNNPKSEVPVPYLTQPSRVIFAGGTVQNGTITNNAQCTDWDSIYEGQSGTVSTILAGSAGLRKTTVGTLTLSGNNTYIGQTTIAKGNLVLGHNNALGTTGNISFNNGSLVYAPGVTVDLSARFQGSIAAIAIDTNGQTVNFASPIASTNGSGLKKLGAGTLILNSANSYTGGTWVQAGTLQTNVDGALSAANDLTISTGAVVDLNGTNQSIANLYSMAGGAWSIVNNKSGTQATLTMSGNLNSNFTGILSDNSAGTGTVALAKSGSGRLTLSGANTFTGPTTINSGSLELASASGPSMNGNLTVASGIWLLLTANNQFGPSSSLNLIGEMALQNTNQTIPMLTGSGSVQNDHGNGPLGAVLSGTATLTINNNVADTFNGTIRDNALGAGKLALIKTGNGTLTLSGSNNYSAGTTINTGTLALSGGSASADTGAVAIANAAGATLLLNASERIGSLAGGGVTGGAVQLGEHTLTVGDATNTTFAGNISGSGGGISKMGVGTLTFSGANTYTGVTTLAGGVLNVATLSNYGAAGSLGNRASDSGGIVGDVGILFRGGTLQYTGSTAQSTNRAIRINADGGGGNAGSATIDASGSNPAATLSFTATSSPDFFEYGGNRTLTLTGSNTGANTFAMAITQTAGTTSLNKTGVGKWVLSGASSYGGQTNITAGTLVAASHTALGAGGHNGGTMTNIYDGATLAMQGGISLDEHFHVWGSGVGGLGALRSISGNNSLTTAFALRSNTTIGVESDTLMISEQVYQDGGSFGITKIGAGTLSLTFNNSYSGATTINAGTLALSGGSAIVDTGVVTIANAVGATLQLNASERIGSLAGGGVTGGAVQLGGHTLTVGDATNTTFAGNISGSGGGINKEGAGTLTLSGTNTYTGTTTIGEGALRITNGSALGTTAGGTTALGTALEIDGSGGAVVVGAEALSTFGGGVSNTGAIRNIAGNNTYGGTVTLTNITRFMSDSGTLTFNNATAITGNAPLILGGAGNFTISGAITTGTGFISKDGAGTLTLSGANTYTGGTVVDSGTLEVTGSLTANSTVTVNSNGTLMGTGTVNGPVSVNSGGTIAPGASAGTLTVGSTTLSGIYSCEIDGATADRISSTGSITINPGATLAFNALNAPTLASYVIASYNSTLTGTFSNVTGTPTGYGVIYDAGLKQMRLEQIGYNRWIADSGLTGAAAAFDADPDHDGIANGLEFVLGGEPNPANPGSNSSGLLPTASESSGNLVLSFRRRDFSESSVLLACQWSTNLIFLSPASDIPVGASSSVIDGVNVSITEDLPDALTDTITITVPAAKTAGGKIFIRLKAQLKPSP